MAKPKVKIDKEPEAVAPEEVKVVAAAPAEAPEIDWPETSTRGKFHFVPFEHGYVVFNTQCQRITDVLSLGEAKDIVLRSNLAAHIKG